MTLPFFARQVVLQPRADLAAALADARDLRSHGFLSAALPFLPEVEGGAARDGAAGPSDEETALWAAVQELNTAGAFRAYVEQFPQGAFAEEARRRAEALEAEAADPLAQAEAAEAALGLSRTQRQQIQRDLNDPRVRSARDRRYFRPRHAGRRSGIGRRAAVSR